MAARYTMKIVTDFAAAHSLRGYPGDCARLHGHNWKIEVEVSASALDAIGMGVDFKVIKQHTKDLFSELDHFNLNDKKPFDRINPTAENLAAYIFSELSSRINDSRARVSSITVWETERACVRYSED